MVSESDSDGKCANPKNQLVLDFAIRVYKKKNDLYNPPQKALI